MEQNQPTRYRLLRGTLMLPSKGKARSVASREYVRQGDLLPLDAGISDREISAWLEEGRIEKAQMTPDVQEQEQRQRRRGKWQVDPSTLIGKSMEDLVLMIQDIDPDYDFESITDEAEAVRLLTSDWDPAFRQIVPPARDAARPEALAAHDLEQHGEQRAVRMGEDRERLERARARAQGPADEAADEAADEQE